MTRKSKLSWLVVVAMMVSSLLLILLVGGCSSTPSSDSQPSAANAKPSGSLTIAAAFRDGGLDPQNNTANTLQNLALGIYDQVVELDSEGKARPGLAERWEMAPDGLSQTFYIRKGVKFHDGSDLTAADVKFSMERITAPESTNVDKGNWTTQIASIQAKDDYTLVIQLRAPMYELLNGFLDYSGSASVLPKKYIEEKGVDYFRTHPIGSGPFKVVGWQPGIRLDLEAVEGHWRATPKFKNISIRYISEEGTKSAMLKTGELDIAEVAPDSAASLKSAGVRIFDFDGGAQYYAGFFYDVDNRMKYPVGDVKVRKALSLATNRQEIADKLYGGYAVPSAMFYVRPSAFFWDPNVMKPDPFDPEQAKKLLAEAGYPNGFSVKIWDLGGGSILSTFNQGLSGYWRKVGVNSDIVAVEQVALQKLIAPKHTPEIWNTVRPTLTGGGIFQFEKFAIVYHSQKSSRKNHSVPGLDDLIDKVPLTKDPVEKKKLALQAATLAKNDLSDMEIIDMRTVLALSPQVGGLTPIKGMVGLAAALETITHSSK
ncbi:MAG: ABC transporter substrate-binding protein [Dehalococcoidia bacterium]|nr:ABC transporter substrate-binding protein [Dehalococcoidia bacterium]